MPTSSAPQTDLPPWASGNYGAGSGSWNGTARRVAANIVALAAAGLTPNLRTAAQFFNEWLARGQEWSAFFRGELGSGIYGDASDGDVTLGAGTTTLTRDMYYDDLTVPNGATLAAAGYRIFVAGLLTVAAGGVVSNDGANAVAAAYGAGGAAGSLAGGGDGGGGLNNTDNTHGTPANAITTAIGGSGGTGGSGAAFTGGTGPATAPTAGLGGWRHVAAALGRASGSATTQWSGGAGGGGGGSDIATGTTGAGGGGGGLVAIFARQISNLGTIRANGGNGSAAASAAAGSAGGGGGGGGGGVWIVHREAVGGSLGTVQASAGTGGAGYSNGTTGTAGASGSAGVVITLIA